MILPEFFPFLVADTKILTMPLQTLFCHLITYPEFREAIALLVCGFGF